MWLAQRIFPYAYTHTDSTESGHVGTIAETTDAGEIQGEISKKEIAGRSQKRINQRFWGGTMAAESVQAANYN
jgi:hypothetical protein